MHSYIKREGEGMWFVGTQGADLEKRQEGADRHNGDDLLPYEFPAVCRNISARRV